MDLVLVFPWNAMLQIAGGLETTSRFIGALRSLHCTGHFLVSVNALWINPQLSPTGDFFLFCWVLPYIRPNVISGFDLVLRYQFRVDIGHETIGLCMLSCNRDQTPAERAKLGIKDNLVQFSRGDWRFWRHIFMTSCSPWISCSVPWLCIISRVLVWFRRTGVTQCKKGWKVGGERGMQTVALLKTDGLQ